jgi:hypothetical protein
VVSADFDMVLCRWADAHMSQAGWQDLLDVEDDGEEIVESVGFLVPQGEPGSKMGHVTLWQTYADGQAIHAMHIPVAMVRELHLLTRDGKIG